MQSSAPSQSSSLSLPQSVSCAGAQRVPSEQAWQKRPSPQYAAAQSGSLQSVSPSASSSSRLVQAPVSTAGTEPVGPWVHIGLAGSRRQMQRGTEAQSESRQS